MSIYSYCKELLYYVHYHTISYSTSIYSYYMKLLYGERFLLFLQEQAYRRMTSSAKVLSDNNSLSKVMLEKSQLERQLG